MIRNDTKFNPVQRGERGSITLIFCLLALIIMGAVSYSLYIGESVKDKIKANSASDFSAYAMAGHAASGLNMIATNNLGIGASLHIAAAAPIIARYNAIVQAALVSFPKSTKDVWYDFNFKTDDSIFASWYEGSQHLSAHFMKTASGLTSINEKIAQYWLIGALPKGLEQMRANVPGAIGLPMRLSHLPGGDLLKFFKYNYPLLKRTSAKNAMCQTIKSSRSINDRNLAIKWLRAPLESVGAPSALGQSVMMGEKLMRGLGDTINIALKPLKIAADALWYTAGCWIEVPWWGSVNPVCGKIQEFRDAAGVGIPMPEFTNNCGLNYQGDFGEMMENFSNEVDVESQPIGFIYPDIKTSEDRQLFNDSIGFAVLLGSPSYTQEELPSQASAAGGQVSICPTGWDYTIGNKTYCSRGIGGINRGQLKANHSASNSSIDTTQADVVTGGLAQATSPTGAAVNPGGLSSIWKRVQWSLGQAQAIYVPVTSDGDPIFAKTDSQSPQMPEAELINRAKMQLFWPAWKARLAQPSVYESILSYIKN